MTRRLLLGAGAIALTAALGTAQASAFSLKSFFGAFAKDDMTAQEDVSANAETNAQTETGSTKDSDASSSSGYMDVMLDGNASASTYSDAEGSSDYARATASQMLDASMDAMLDLQGETGPDQDIPRDSEVSIFARIVGWLTSLFGFSSSVDTSASAGVRY
jgi:hypothetical protein